MPFPTSSLQRRKKGLAGLHQPKQKSKPALLIGLPQDFRQISSIIDVDILPETHLRVRLHKHGTNKPLGFYIRDGVSVRVTPQGVEKVPGVFISRLVKGGLAESTGLLGVNDEILEVNGIDVASKSLDQVTDMMVANSHNLIVTVKPVNQRNNTMHRASKTSAGNSSAGSGGSALSHDSAPSPASQNASQYSNSNSVAEGDSDDDTDLILENDNLSTYMPHRMTNGNGSHANALSSGAFGHRPLPQSVSLPSSSSLSSLTTPTHNGSPTKTSSSQESMREDGNFITLWATVGFEAFMHIYKKMKELLYHQLLFLSHYYHKQQPIHNLPQWIEDPRPHRLHNLARVWEHVAVTVWKCLMALHSSRLSYYFFFWDKSTIFISIDSEVC